MILLALVRRPDIQDQNNFSIVLFVHLMQKVHVHKSLIEFCVV